MVSRGRFWPPNQEWQSLRRLEILCSRLEGIFVWDFISGMATKKHCLLKTIQFGWCFRSPAAHQLIWSCCSYHFNRFLLDFWSINDISISPNKDSKGRLKLLFCRNWLNKTHRVFFVAASFFQMLDSETQRNRCWTFQEDGSSIW